MSLRGGHLLFPTTKQSPTTGRLLRQKPRVPRSDILKITRKFFAVHVVCVLGNLKSHYVTYSNAFLSYLPAGDLGGKDTGEMNVYVRDLTRELGRMGIHVDVFTRSQDDHVPHVVHELGFGIRVVQVPPVRSS